MVVAAALAAGTGSLAPSAQAAVIVVTTTADTVAADGQTSLREAVQLASTNAESDVIQLSSGASYALTQCALGPLDHTAAEDLTLQGSGATVTQSCDNTEVFRSSNNAATLTMQQVNLVGGPNTGVTVNGAGIYSEGHLVLTDSTVTGADAGPGGVVVDGATGSGVPFDIDIGNSQLTGNTGSVVNIDFGSVRIVGSEISGNTGDAVALIDGSPLVVTDSTISDNTGRGVSTTGQGSTNLTLENATVANNGSTGVSCSACGTTTVTDSTITGNGSTAAAGTGGGVSFTVDQDDPGDAPTLTITDSTIDDNAAQRRGGGVFVGIVESSEPTAPPTQVTITDGSVSGNHTNGDDLDGGGIAVTTGDLTVVGTTIFGNSTGVGGGSTSSGGGIFAEESAGDGVDIPYEVTLDGVTLAGNTATGGGGGAFAVTDGAVTVSLSAVTGNSTPTASGGGLSVHSTTATLSETEIDANTAQSAGGLSFSGAATAGSLTMTASTLGGNTATSPSGLAGGIGVFAPAGTSANITNSTISGNQAFRGGGIATGLDESVVLDGVTVAGNTGTEGANLAAGFGTITIGSSVVAEPLGGGVNCTAVSLPSAFASAGFSFVSDATCNSGPDDTISAADPQLGSLADNGGTTQTRLPAATGPIGGLIPLANCGLPNDQRNVSRPQGVRCEPGSVEIEEEGVPLTGTKGDDVLSGTPFNDLIRGLAGDDTLSGLGGHDQLEGGPGRDRMDGGTGDDVLIGGPGNDHLDGGPGNDRLDGGPGRDVLIADSPADVLVGGPGRDECFLPASPPTDC
jgi:CSLREA domain-containing protein